MQAFAGHSDAINAVALSPDGKYAATGSADTTARLWDTASGKELKRFTGHTGVVRYVSFSPDVKFLLTSGDGNTARVWDISTGREVRRFVNEKNPIMSSAYSPDGKWMLTMLSDGSAQVWQADYHDAVHDLCGKLLRDFTDDERTQYEIKDNKPTCPKQ